MDQISTWISDNYVDHIMWTLTYYMDFKTGSDIYMNHISLHQTSPNHFVGLLSDTFDCRGVGFTS